jgi:phage gp45-like
VLLKRKKKDLKEKGSQDNNMQQLFRTLHNKIQSLIKRGYVSRASNNDINIPYPNVQITYFNRTANAEMIFPYGMQGMPPENTPVIIINTNSQEENLSCIPYLENDRFKGLNSGEVKFGAPSLISYIYFKNDKSIEINGNYKIAITSSDDITINSSKNVNITSTDDINLTSTNDIDLKPSGSFNVTSTNFKLNNGDAEAKSLILDNLTPLKQVMTDANKKLVSGSSVFSEEVPGLDYDQSTGILSLSSGYVIPTTIDESSWNNAYASTYNATAIDTSNTIVKRDANGRAALSLNDDAATPVLSIDHNNRNLCSTSGVKTLGWGAANLEVYNDSGTATFSFERLTGRLSLVGLIVNGGTTLSKYEVEKPNVTFSGIWASSQTKQLTVQIIGNVVTILFPDCLATANTASYISATMPSGYYPGSATLHMFIPRTTDNGTNASAPSLITIDTHGALKIYNGVSNFTGSGSSGFKSFCLTFNNS